MTSLRSWLSANSVIGNPHKFSLEERIFNTFCTIAVVAFFIEIFFNYYIGLKWVAVLCAFGTLFAALLYYFSRFKRSTKLATRSLGVAANITFLVNYFLNSGIHGPNLLLFCLVLLVTIVVVPKQELAFWISFNMITVFGVLAYEYLNPGIIKSAYQNELSKVVDFAVTYGVAALLICLSITFIRNNYDKERSVVTQKNAEIEAQSFKILQQNKELEKLNLEKAKLFSIVAHDIRSPLSSILGYLEVLAEMELSELENNQIKHKLLQVTKDTSEMLANVLAWSKSQMDGTKVDIVPVDVGLELQKGLNLEKDIAARKGIALTLTVPSNVVVAADLNMFQIVVRNLVNNAIKFTPEGGEVEVSVAHNARNCFIKVKDNGMGVPAHEQANLFKLKALSTFGTNNEKGVGLGLLLCKEFTELQDGKIWYETNEQPGSTFVLSFNLYGLAKLSEM